MKIFTCLFILATSLLYSQNEVDELKITPDGVNGYLVLEFPSLTTSEIYNKLEKWAQYNIRDAERSNYSTIDNEYLAYRVRYVKALEEKFALGTNFWDIVFDAEYRIKDNRLRIDILNIEIPTSDGSMGVLEIQRGGMYGLYNRKGEPRKHYLKFIEQFDEKLNKIIEDIESSISGNPDIQNSDW